MSNGGPEPARRAAAGRPGRAARPARVRRGAATRSVAALIQYGSTRQPQRSPRPLGQEVAVLQTIVVRSERHPATWQDDGAQSDLLLRRSFHVLRPTAASLVRAAFLVVWLPLDVYGLRPLRACGGHDPGQVSPTGAVALGPSPYHVDSGSRPNCCDAGQGRFRCHPGAGPCLWFLPRSGTRLARSARRPSAPHSSNRYRDGAARSGESANCPLRNLKRSWSPAQVDQLGAMPEYVPQQRRGTH